MNDVARRIEEVHATEAMAQLLGQYVGEGIDAQPGRVAGQHGVIGHEWGDASIEILLPVHALGDRLDDKVALAQQFQTVVVIGRRNDSSDPFGGQGRRRQSGQSIDGFHDDAVGITVLGGEVEQHRVDAGIGQVRSDLRSHHTCTEDGCAPDK
jgi:hypothetical protein